MSVHQVLPCYMWRIHLTIIFHHNPASLGHISGVPAKPEIMGLSRPAAEGEDVTLTCTTSGSKPAANIRWFRNDKEVQGKQIPPDSRGLIVHDEQQHTFLLVWKWYMCLMCFFIPPPPGCRITFLTLSKLKPICYHRDIEMWFSCLWRLRSEEVSGSGLGRLMICW